MTEPPTKPLTKPPSLGYICEKLNEGKLRNVHDMASMYLMMGIRYYADVLQQAKWSFVAALVAGIAGVGFFIAAAVMYKDHGVGWIGLISGAFLHLLSGTCFYVYGKASAQFGAFHICLDRSNRFALANNICESLGDPTKGETRAYLVRAIAEAALVTPEVTSGKRGIRHKSQISARRRVAVEQLSKLVKQDAELGPDPDRQAKEAVQ